MTPARSKGRISWPRTVTRFVRQAHAEGSIWRGLQVIEGTVSQAQNRHSAALP